MGYTLSREIMKIGRCDWGEDVNRLSRRVHHGTDHRKNGRTKCRNNAALRMPLSTIIHGVFLLKLCPGPSTVISTGASTKCSLESMALKSPSAYHMMYVL